MSSITTAIPTGVISEWCIQNLYADFFGTDIAQCANSSRGTTEADFDTICCDGQIIDKTQNLWDFTRHTPVEIDVANLLCCRIEGPQAGGFGPIITGDGLTCTSGTPTPLASLAATNTANAQIYPVTFTSASGQAPNIGDFLFTLTPQCLWADTKSAAGMTEITVPAASITALPYGWPDSNDPLITTGFTSTSNTRATGSGNLFTATGDDGEPTTGASGAQITTGSRTQAATTNTSAARPQKQRNLGSIAMFALVAFVTTISGS